MQNVTQPQTIAHLRAGNDQYGSPIRPSSSWGVYFQIKGQDAVREMGRHHDFNSYDEAVQWVEDNKYRADKAFTSFHVFCWP